MRCPVCKAVVEQGPQCRRCRADLSLLFDLEKQAEETRRAGVHRATAGRLDEAIRLAEDAARVHQNAESQRLLAIVHLLRRDFASAYQAYRQLKQTPN